MKNVCFNFYGNLILIFEMVIKLEKSGEILPVWAYLKERFASFGMETFYHVIPNKIIT